MEEGVIGETRQEKGPVGLVEDAFWQTLTDVIRRGGNDFEIKKFLQTRDLDTGYSNRVLIARTLMDHKSPDGKFVLEVNKSGDGQLLAMADDIRVGNNEPAMAVMLNQDYGGWKKLEDGKIHIDADSTLKLLQEVAKAQSKIELNDKFVTRVQYFEQKNRMLGDSKPV